MEIKKFTPNIQLFADEKTFTQEEVNRMIEERIAREKKKFDSEKKELERQHGETIEEYEERIKNANLTAEEKHKKELEKIQKDLELKNAELTKIKTDEIKRATLSKYKLPQSFLDRIGGITEEEIETSVKGFSEAIVSFLKEQAGADPELMNGGSKGTEITKEKFKNMSYSERVELYTNDKAKYDALNN